MKAVFLDKDGTINEDRYDYVKGLWELRIFPFVRDAVRRLKEAGYLVLVASNQQAIAKGLTTEADLYAMQDEIARQTGIDGFYYCRHFAHDRCACRKPEPGMLLQAAEEYGIDLAESFMVGDMEKDILAGKRAGCKAILVKTGLRRQPVTPADFVAETLTEAVDYILEAK